MTQRVQQDAHMMRAVVAALVSLSRVTLQRSISSRMVLMVAGVHRLCSRLVGPLRAKALLLHWWSRLCAGYLQLRLHTPILRMHIPIGGVSTCACTAPTGLSPPD